MSDNDLIRRGDALAVVANGKTTWGEAVTAIAALPAVTVGVPEATVHRAVLDWIGDDAGAAVKMSMTPDRANALTARILAALEPQPAPDAVGVPEAADRIEALMKERDILIDRHERNLIVGAETRARAERLEAALHNCVGMLDQLVAESGRDIEWDAEDPFRMGEWFEPEDLAQIEQARAALTQKEPTNG